ncbi:protein SLOW GREEN 1, chloroplastic-like [Andrographis paniculata]|uniref:protein SLOW GREEN 1, chloroplastic-like n=1 Tax=Andrographis paniculata TaxID=175694 RepID=UPI0021E7EFE0|nr:protein SLOW GREEN 1, chloroplastic-like [Andrographis paniculata]XP_051130220.1 protein SLOW GREEN 1, chloroplastic-like [Andrographis paniculata]
MFSLSISAATPAAGRSSAVPPLVSRRLYLGEPLSSLAFGPSRRPLALSSPIRASSQKPIDGGLGKSFNFQKFQVSDENSPPETPANPFVGVLKAGLVTTIAAAALTFARFCLPIKPALADATYGSPSVGTTAHLSISEKDKERLLRDQLASNPYDVDGLQQLVEVKVKSGQIGEAIVILNKLIELEPRETQWLLMRSHLRAHRGETSLARQGFHQLLEMDPYCVEGYHGLMIIASQNVESPEELVKVEKQALAAKNLCKKENKKGLVRDFLLLLAQIRVLQGKPEESLKIYQDLVREEPTDFRPYICQGIVYTILGMEDEAEQNFQKYKRLLPKGHPCAAYFNDNVLASKLYAKKMHEVAEEDRAIPVVQTNKLYGRRMQEARENETAMPAMPPQMAMYT